MKRKLFIIAYNSGHWAGGLYYKRNIVFSLLCNDAIVNQYDIYVLTNASYKSLFAPFKDKIHIKTIRENRIERRIQEALCGLIHRNSIIFPEDNLKVRNIIGKRCVSWIPDFQHNVFPDFFEQTALDERTARFSGLIRSDSPLVVSSLAAKSDCERFYGKKEKLYVVPFVSFIEPEIKEMMSKESRILKSYDLHQGEYVCVSNQFWRHKNHIIVFDAIKRLAQTGGIDLKFVFTGEPRDDRDKSYYNSIMERIQDPQIREYVRVLGFIDRIDQLAIMKNSQFIIQPSLFEGWGTVVEDAKVLDKLILLSDIPVHREQMNNNCILFDPHDPIDLAEKIIAASGEEHEDCIGKGIQDMHTRAETYSKEFQRMLEECY